ncbi:phosphatidylinositol-specific phospholipase C domain-containing protein [Photorhabdus khanii]|uniref:1-phosphatidylinositol phosphodiesterase n=1 Tax=Photorhabdus khanii TaxID=1004150 RepID=A0A7C9KTS3_9GAMM|nr:phosphatidylinositol-specific phospholipase C domain-containing protein [Photorhabdus khanii]MQL50006.1 phosphatidylinositol-specific phospholipase C domain-containing protein [Photorhabdus khanii]
MISRIILTLFVFLCAGCAANDCSMNDMDMSLPDTPEANWMGRVDDNVTIAGMSIPGTHDSATSEIDQVTGFGYIRTQDLKITGKHGQLAKGARVFDFRLKRHCDSPNLNFYHGSQKVSDMSLNQVLSYMKLFLEKYKTEVIFLRVKDEEDNDSERVDFAKRVYENFRDSGISLYDGSNTNPKLSEVRGKIIILKNYNSDGESEPKNINYSSLKIFDLWNAPSFEDKKQNIEDGVKGANNATKENKIYMIYLSANKVIGCDPACYHNEMTPFTIDLIDNLPRQNTTGIIMSDFYKISDWRDKIISRNPMKAKCKIWGDGGNTGSIGDIYIYKNPYQHQEKEYFKLLKTSYWYFPTNRTSDSTWQYMGVSPDVVACDAS